MSSNRINSILPAMVNVPAGPFIMGSSKAEVLSAINNGVSEEAAKMEFPQHTLFLPEYSIGRYLVTNAEYRVFVLDTGKKPPEDWEGADHPKGKGNHPVVYVSWHDAIAFCSWLSMSTGDAYSLPSEAEWEKAARGSSKAFLYPWGNNFGINRCNTREAGIGDTTPVGQFSPKGDSPYGCADMSGNVWEWTRSLREDYIYQPDDGREDLTAADHVQRIIRGGAFYTNQDRARVSSRNSYFPGYWDHLFGFRVVLPKSLARE